MARIKKYKKRVIAGILAFCTILTVVFVSDNIFANAGKIEETNPEFTKIDINGDIEVVDGSTSYTPSSTYTQDTAKGEYSLSSNAYCAWGGSDDVSFAYRQYNVAPVDSDSLTLEVTLHSLTSDTAGNGLHANASAGLMIRSGLQNNSAAAFLHVREEGLMIVYRQKEGGGYSHTSAKSVTFPVQLKITIQKKTIECRYKDANADTWRLAGYVSMDYTGPIYGGLCSHSVDQKTYAKGVFSDYSATGKGSYDPESGGSTDDGSTITKPTEPVDPDLDLSANKNIVLYETFSEDGKLAIGKNAQTGKDYTYQWTSGQKRYDYDNEGAMTEDSPKYFDMVTKDGNRYWYKSLLQDSIDFIGDMTWSDYKVSMDVQYTEMCDPSAENAMNMIALCARSRIVEWYGYSDYAAVLQNELINNESQTTISLYKRVNNSLISYPTLGKRIAGPISVDNFIGDGKWHNIALSVFDNTICVYYDGEKLIEYEDDGLENRTLTSQAGTWEEIMGFGRVGISTYQTDCYIDNIIVELLPDTLNGNYDNYVGGGWNDPIPSLIEDWTQDKKYSYYFNGVNGSNDVASEE